jgi:dienelactone hydrolase
MSLRYKIYNSKQMITNILLCLPGVGNFPNHVYKHIAKNHKNMLVIELTYSKAKIDVAVLNAYQCLKWIHSKYIDIPIFVLGWSFGGAVAINCVRDYEKLYKINNIKGLITIASQGKYADCISEIKIPKLIIHGYNDSCIPVTRAYKLHDMSKNIKFLTILENNEHDCSDSYEYIIDFIEYFTV